MTISSCPKSTYWNTNKPYKGAEDAIDSAGNQYAISTLPLSIYTTSVVITGNGGGSSLANVDARIKASTGSLPYDKIYSFNNYNEACGAYVIIIAFG